MDKRWQARLKRLWHDVTQWLVRLGLNVSGLVMLLSFPASWIAWLPGMSVGVLGAAVGSAFLHCALLRLEEPAADDREPDPGTSELVLNPVMNTDARHRRAA